MRDRPVTEDRLAVDKILLDKSPVATIVAGIPVIPQYEIMAGRDHNSLKRFSVAKIRPQIRFEQPTAIHVDRPTADFHLISRYT
jgi:hypothetical protein